MRNGDEGVTKAGWLNKKSPKGVPGFRTWQKRWFVLGKKDEKTEERVLRYFKSETDTTAIATLSLRRVVKVVVLPSNRKGCRFDIKMDNSRVYALDALTPKDAKDWHSALSEAVKIRNRQSIIEKPKGIIGDSWTAFQHMFFKAKFSTQEVKSSTKTMNENFMSDAKVLIYLLEKVLDPLDLSDEVDLISENSPSGTVDTGGTKEYQEEGGLYGTIKVSKSGGLASDLKRSDSTLSTSAMDLATSATTTGATIKRGSRIYVKRGRTKEEFARILQRDGKLKVEGNYELFQKVKTPEFIRHLLHIFASKDDVAHGLAIRVLWIVLHNLYPQREAAKQFAANVNIFCAGPKYNNEIKDSLFILLFTEPQDVVKNLSAKIEATFFKPFKQPAVIPSFFSALQTSPFPLRTKALEDLNTTLIGSGPNVDAMLRTPDWQKLLFMLLTDIPKADVKLLEGRDAEEEKLVRKAYGYVMNVFAIVHFEKFETTKDFIPHLCQTLDELVKFAGPCEGAYQVSLVMVTSIASKLTGKKSKQLFATDDYSSFPYSNLLLFFHFVKRFVFHTAHWRTSNKPQPFNTLTMGGSTRGPAPAMTVTTRPTALTTVSESSLDGSNHSERGGAFGGGGGGGEPESSPWIIQKARFGGGKNTKTTTFMDLEEYGVHFNDVGDCGDKVLLQLLLSITKSLGLDKYDPETHKDIELDNKNYLMKMEAETQFMEDSIGLLGIIKKSGIKNGRITFRYLANVIQRWLTAPSSTHRAALMDEMTDVMAGTKPMGGFTSRLATSLATSTTPMTTLG